MSLDRTDFAQVVEKLRWAGPQMSRLYKHVAAYLNSGPYLAVVEEDADAEVYRATAKLQAVPGPEIPLAFGDLLNTLHGTLDFLAWQLVILSGEEPGRNTWFPIVADRRKAGGGVNILDAARRKAIKDPLIRLALDDVQPYSEGEYAIRSPLEMLRRLNGESKHQVIPLTTVSAASGVQVVQPDNASVLGRLLNGPVTLAFASEPRIQDGDEIAHLPIAGNPRPPQQIPIPAQVFLTAAQDPFERISITDVGDLLYMVVSAIVHRFSPFFDFEVGDMPTAEAAWIPFGAEELRVDPVEVTVRAMTRGTE